MKGTFSRFIAIAAIVALGVGLLSGLMAMPIDMRTTIDEYFDRQNMHDLRIVSPLGLTDDDVAAIAAVDGVDEVMPAYMTDMFVDAGEKKNIVTRIHSLPTGQIEEKEPENYLNRLDVVEGRLPIQRNECVLVEGNVIDGTGPLSVGNTLTIAATNGDVSGTLADTEFKIVGIVRTSYYFSVDRESATIGDGTVALKMYVGEESFSQEAYSEIFATVAGAQALDSASDEYQAAVDAVADRVEAVSGARCTARYNEVKTDTEQKLADARQELEDAKAEAAEKLGDAEEQLDEGRPEDMWSTSEDVITRIVDYIFEHKEPFDLLINHAAGSGYEHFLDDLVEEEVSQSLAYLDAMRERGLACASPSHDDLHALVSAEYYAFFEIVRHDTSKEDAVARIKLIVDFFRPGWENLFGG